MVLAACLKFHNMEGRDRRSSEQANEHCVQLTDSTSMNKVMGDQGRFLSLFLDTHEHALPHVHSHTCLHAHSHIYEDNSIWYLKTLNNIPENS